MMLFRLISIAFGLMFFSPAFAADPCNYLTKSFTPINISSAATTVMVIGSPGKKTYVCGLDIIPSIADNVGVIEGTTGTTCGTLPLGVIGGPTSATGINLGANQFVAVGDGASSIAASKIAGDDVCLITSSSAQLSGVLTTVQQ